MNAPAPHRIPRLTLYYELEDGTIGEERIINPTFVAFERAKAKRADTADPWPDGKLTLYTFSLYHQLKAKGTWTGSWKDFQDKGLIHVSDQLLDDDTQEAPAVDPTPPDLDPSSCLP